MKWTFMQGIIQPFPHRQLLDTSKLKAFADDNSRFNENGRKFFKRLKKHCGKRRNCSLRAISPFPTLFSNGLYGRHVKTGLVWERVKSVYL